MRKFTLPVLLLLCCCTNNANRRISNDGFFSFKSQFPECLPEEIRFRSDSAVATQNLKKIERGDSLFLHFMAPVLIENGGYYYGKYSKGNGMFDLYVYVLDADIPGPVFTVMSKFGKKPRHFIGYQNPGNDAGFESLEFCGLDVKGQFFFRDLTKTWDPEDSLASPVKNISQLKYYNPLLRGDFEATYSPPPVLE